MGYINLELCFLILICLVFCFVKTLPRPGVKEQILKNKRYPNQPESSYTASGAFVKKAQSSELEKLSNENWTFRDEDKSIFVTKSCKDRLSELAIQVKLFWKNQYTLVLVDAFEENLYDKFKTNSLHYEGRAIDVTLGKKSEGGLETIYKLSRPKRMELFAILGELAYNKAKFSYVLMKGHHIHLSCRRDSSSN